MFAIADSLGEEVGARARRVAQQIVGVTDMASAGVALLQDIKTMFDRSTLDHVTSKAVIEELTADAEKRWAEWSRGKPITEKGVATLLHEYHIVSRTVGPKDARAKGYRKADFEDAWERYLPEAEKAEGGPNLDNLPFTRSPPCNDYTFAEKTAVHQDDGEREKIEHFSSEINAVNGRTGKTSEMAPSASDAADDGLDLPAPPDRRRNGKNVTPPDRGGRTCAQCNADGEPLAQVEGTDPPVYLHPECQRFWFKDHPEADGIRASLRRAPALGPAGDSP